MLLLLWCCGALEFCLLFCVFRSCGGVTVGQQQQTAPPHKTGSSEPQSSLFGVLLLLFVCLSLLCSAAAAVTVLFAALTHTHTHTHTHNPTPNTKPKS
jgi:hypothetical protein